MLTSADVNSGEMIQLTPLWAAIVDVLAEASQRASQEAA